MGRIAMLITIAMYLELHFIFQSLATTGIKKWKCKNIHFKINLA
jgi:hypothetical protein